MIKNYFLKRESFTLGLAMFSMFFGAGNVIFPLAVGQFAGDKNHFAIFGLILTAAIMPIAGVIAMILFEGNYRDFFHRLGRIPGFLLALVTISLLGPLGSTPRCIALAYSTLKGFMVGVSPTLFCGLACGMILLFTIRKNHILTLLGWILTPALLGSLFFIIAVGLYNAPPAQVMDQPNLSFFVHGLKEGYNTMDLLAAFFFSSTIINILRMRSEQEGSQDQNFLNTVVAASVYGAILLAATYIGFSYIASFHGQNLSVSSKDELLSAMIINIAGAKGGVLVCIAIALACLTTAIALISSFTDFIQKEVFKEKVSYEITLISSLLLTFFVATFEFSGISTFLGPVLEICYPGLIILTFLNIAYRLKNFQPIKVPVFFMFAISAIIYFIK